MIYVVGIGPGGIPGMTEEARQAIENSDVIVGYKVYTDLVREFCTGKEVVESGMRQEIDRCRLCLEYAKNDKVVALICSGDAGVYGMASPMLEVAAKEGYEDVKTVPGVTAALSGAASLGAPIGHDFCVISLSDLLTPWDLIEKRLKLAAQADLCIVLYNPSSRKRSDHLKRACDIMLTTLPAGRQCGYVRNIGRNEMGSKVCTLEELASEQVDMFTTVFIGNSQTRIDGGWLITPRGYASE